VLYRDRLQDSGSAAQCLEEGGLLSEAIELYESLKRFEKAGDLYRKLGQAPQAEHAYREAARILLSAHDHLGAARLLHQKLDALHDAVKILNDAWPHSGQASLCLDELFFLLGKAARHDDARSRLASLRDEETAPLHAQPLSRVLAKVAASYPSTD